MIFKHLPLISCYWIAFQKLNHQVHFIVDSRGQNCQSPHLNYTDVFSLDGLNFFVGVKNSKWILVTGSVVSKNQIQLIARVGFPCDRRNGIMRCLFSKSQYIHHFIGIG